MMGKLGLIVARPGLVRDGLQAVFQAMPGIDALEPADDGASALIMLKNHRADLVILDSSLSEDELMATISRIKGQYPDVRCLVVTDNPVQLWTLKAAGTDTVLIKGFSAAVLFETIKFLLK